MAEACAGWTDQSGNHHDCQFGYEAADQKFGGKEYCRFHLPMGKPGEGGKADWDDEQQAAISNAIVDRIKAEIEKPEEQRGELDFRGVVVPGVFHLDEETIWALDMRGAQFHGDAWFQRAVFYRDAQFGGVRFYRDARFVSGNFQNDAEFSEAQFNGLATFREAKFTGGAAFGKAQFCGSTEFEYAQFSFDAEFEDAQFANARFGWARFSGDAQFTKAQFDGDAWFHEAVFGQRAWFHEAQFNGDAGFLEARFHGQVWFHKAQFHKQTLFSGTADPKSAAERVFNDTNFRCAQFGGRADFSNREFRDRTDFSGCVFKRAPNFHGSALHQDTAFGGIECFPDVTSDGADRAYRTLRQAMEGHRARVEEGMFYTLEQKARRRKMRRYDPAYWMSLGYELGSNYGFSVVRPLFWLVVGIFASATLLLGIGWNSGVGTDHATMFNKALLFSFRQLFVPFDALRSTDKILAAYAFNPGGTSWLQVWGVVVTLFEGLSALLLVLAVRWRYRR